MTLAVALNAASILTAVGRSLIGYMGSVTTEIAAIGFLVTLVHHAFEIVAEILGIVLVFKEFRNVRLWMRVTEVFWLIALAFGISIYIIYYIGL
jgi:hypothetical protein